MKYPACALSGALALTSAPPSGATRINLQEENARLRDELDDLAEHRTQRLDLRPSGVKQ